MEAGSSFFYDIGKGSLILSYKTRREEAEIRQSAFCTTHGNKVKQIRAVKHLATRPKSCLRTFGKNFSKFLISDNAHAWLASPTLINI